MTIKHLVLPGGGVNGIKTIGILSELSKANLFDTANIESIYGTSVGAVIAVLIALKYDWEYIIDYVIKRPWNEAIHFSLENIFGIFTTKGIFDEKLYEIFFRPFFDAKDISLSITLDDFFQKYPVHLHLYTLNVNKFEIVDVNHITHPELPLLTAIKMSSALPIIITPVMYENQYYVDGAFGCNYPLSYCLENHNIDEVLCIYNSFKKSDDIDKTSNIFDYIIFFGNKMINNLMIKSNDVKGNYEGLCQITCEASEISLNEIYEVITFEESRSKLLQEGIKIAEEYITNV
jgi:predicted acylesterase/phospholipase RssA